MFTNIDYDKFPLVNVKLSKNIENDNDLDKFFETWLKLYKLKKKFTFLFDTTDCGSINIRYCYAMAEFIKKLKKTEKEHYLEYSIIILKSSIVKFLVKTIFLITKPVSKVYIVNSSEDANKVYEKIKNKEEIDKKEIKHTFVNNV
jgi:hypothetical protein